MQIHYLMPLEGNSERFSISVGFIFYRYTHTHRSTEVRSGVFMMCDLICWLSKQVDNTRGWTLERERETERRAGRERASEGEGDTQGVWKSIVSAFYHS